MRQICPECHMKMERRKVWFDGEKLRKACVYCYMNWRTEYQKRRSAKKQDDTDTDDIL